MIVEVVVHVVKEFGHTNVVVFQELDNVHALAALLRLRYVGVMLKELCHRDVIEVLVVKRVLGVLP